MTSTSRRQWCVFTGAALLGGCGGGGGGGGGDDPGATTTLSLSGPATGAVGAASASFTVSVSGPVAAAIAVTPGSGGGGTFVPAVVTLTAAAPSATFTFTPTSAGARTIGITNDRGLANPAGITYTATTSSGGGANPTFTHLASGKGADGATQQATSPVTLVANRLALLSVVNVATLPQVPTVAGWDLVATHVTGDINRVSIFRRMASTDSTQAHVISFGGQVQFFNRWSIEQSGASINRSGTNGSGAIVQVARGGAVGLVQSCLLTFGAPFASASHSTFAAFGGGVTSATPTVGSGFVELARPGVEPFGDRALFVQYKPAADTTADMTWSGGGDIWTGVAVEIAA